MLGPDADAYLHVDAASSPGARDARALYTRRRATFHARARTPRRWRADWRSRRRRGELRRAEAVLTQASRRPKPQPSCVARYLATCWRSAAARAAWARWRGARGALAEPGPALAMASKVAFRCRGVSARGPRALRGARREALAWWQSRGRLPAPRPAPRVARTIAAAGRRSRRARGRSGGRDSKACWAKPGRLSASLVRSISRRSGLRSGVRLPSRWRHAVSSATSGSPSAAGPARLAFSCASCRCCGLRRVASRGGWPACSGRGSAGHRALFARSPRLLRASALGACSRPGDLQRTGPLYYILRPDRSLAPQTLRSGVPLLVAAA